MRYPRRPSDVLSRRMLARSEDDERRSQRRCQTSPDLRTVRSRYWNATGVPLPRSGVRRPRRVVAAVAAVVILAAAGCTGAPSGDDRRDEESPDTVEGPFRAFTADSWWNLPVPD